MRDGWPLLLFDAFDGFPARLPRLHQLRAHAAPLRARHGLPARCPPRRPRPAVARASPALPPVAPVVVPEGRCWSAGSRQTRGRDALPRTPLARARRRPLPRHGRPGGRPRSRPGLGERRRVPRVHQRPDRLSIWILRNKHGRILAREYWQHGRPRPSRWSSAATRSPGRGLHGAALRGVRVRLRGRPPRRPLPVVELPERPRPRPRRLRSCSRANSSASPRSRSTRGHSARPGTTTTKARNASFGSANVYHRRAPILLGEPPQRPWARAASGACRRSRSRSGSTWSAAASPTWPGVWPFGNTLMIVVALRRRYAGHAKQALLATAGLRSGASMYTYYVVGGRRRGPVEPQGSALGNVDALDPAPPSRSSTMPGRPTSIPACRLKRAAGELTVGRLLIDACRPSPGRTSTPAATSSRRNSAASVDDKYRDLLDSFSTPASRAQAMFDPRLH